MNPDSYFRGQHVVITGGSSGIGLAFAKQVAGLGAKVTLVARRQEVLQSAQAEVVRAAAGASVSTLALDVANEEAVKNEMGALADRERVDMLVNNAGVVMPGRFLDIPTSEFHNMMNVNYFGSVYMAKATLPGMVSRGTGHVLNVSSLAGVLAIFGYTAYSASKFALVGLSQALRAEMWPHGVRVSVCLPPDTDTPQLQFENEHKPAETKAIAGNVKMLSPEAVASSMTLGMARGSFEIYPDLASRMVALGQGALPAVTRWVCDAAQKKVGASS